MTAPRPPVRRASVLGVLLIAVAVLGGAGLWYVLFRPSGPPPVSLGSMVPATAAPAPSGSPGAGSGSSPGTGTTAAAAQPVAGVWTTDPSASSSSGPATFVGYRVREELANIGATEAVGRTSDVTGSIRIEGTTVVEAEVTADLTTLQSDSPNRDRQLSRQALETGTYPQAVFTLTAPIELGAEPAEGQVLEVSASGNLTLHGVTRAVTIPLQARLEGGVIAIAGSLEIAFADFGIVRPQAMVVLSVEDHGILELLVHLTRCCG
jgi:polyisoprenoid-binding protein YceI